MKQCSSLAYCAFVFTFLYAPAAFAAPPAPGAPSPEPQKAPADKDADTRPSCELEVVYDANTPPWLFWLFKKGTQPCAGGVSACLTKDGTAPRTTPLEEGDTFSGVCWTQLPNGAPAPVNSRIIDNFIIQILPYLWGPTL